MHPDRDAAPPPIPPAPCGERDELLLVFSRDAVRRIDQAAHDELCIPTILLMEHASIGLERHVLHMAPPAPDLSDGVLIVCGKGNNAGDGLALARHLHLAGRRVQVVLAGPPDSYRGDAATNLTIAGRMGIPLRVADEADPATSVYDAAADLDGLGLVVDALLGTGTDGPARGVIRGLIQAVNALADAGALVLAVDIPSGLDADTGLPAGVAGTAAASGGGAEESPAVVTADRTVTFVGLKTGFMTIDAQEFLGEVFVESIGIPHDFAARFGEVVTPRSHPGTEAGEDEKTTGTRRPGSDGRAGGKGSGPGGAGGGGMVSSRHGRENRRRPARG